MPRNCVVRLNERPDMAIVVLRERKTTTQHNITTLLTKERSKIVQFKQAKSMYSNFVRLIANLMI